MKRYFLVLWFLCILGSLAVLPYLHHVMPRHEPVKSILISVAAQAAILYAIICILSYLLVKRTDLTPFAHDQFFKRVVMSGIIAGISAGVLLSILSVWVFPSSILHNGVQKHPVWIGLLASLYGGINEEVQLRLFLFTFCYFLVGKLLAYRTFSLWITNFLVALAFGIGHLPAAYQLITLSGYEITRILVLNGVAGLIFGWLYWSRGLWSAMFAHFVADLIIHVL